MIDAQTAIYGVIGNPVTHSLSPMLHNAAFRRIGLNAVYLAFEVRNLKEAIYGIKALGIRGVSVILPFKTQVIPLLDEVDGVAKKINAVNTIQNRDGRLIGYNTDWWAAMEALEEKVDLKGKRVLLLGAGGAARAIGFGLKERGAQGIISNRSMKRGMELAQDLGFDYKPLASLEGVEFEVVINATSVGMWPNENESPLPKAFLRERVVVMDIVYHPLKTRFLRDAEDRGCLTIDGIEMLARQAVGQLEIWTGQRLSIHPIKEDLRKEWLKKE